MQRLTITLALIALALTSAGTARAQFEAGTFSLGPEFGFGIDGNFGVSFGGIMTYAFTDAMAIGPVFAYSTAGRKFELGEGQNSFTTKSSNSLIIGARFYYMFNPEYDYPWYIDAGFGMLRYSAISESDDDQKFYYQNAEAEFVSTTRFAFNFGGGTMFELNENMTLVTDVNSYIGSHGDPTIKSSGGEINYTDAGSFWFLNMTVGLRFTL